MPKPTQIGRATLFRANCCAVLPTLGLVDAVVTDPPYHLGFLGQKWDRGDLAFRPETWARIAAVLKPGGYLLAFGGSRTHHRIWCAIEDAGFVIEDTIMWLYGQGIPKNKAKLKPAFEPIVVAYKPGGARTVQIDECRIRRGSLGAGWPANLCHDGSDEVMAAFAAFGERNNHPHGPGIVTPGMFGAKPGHPGFRDTGTAARFFYCAKAGKKDRAGSKHPTIKPLALMRWLVRLVTPPGGVVLDPFAGSGTTGQAALEPAAGRF